MKKTTAIAGMVLALAAVAQADVIANGTVIGVDFGNGDGTTPNWNNVVAQTGSIAAASVIDTSGVVVDGVTFAWNVVAPNSFINNNGAENNTQFPGQPTSIPNTALGDWLGGRDVNNDEGGVSITLTIGGLSDALTYNIVVGAANDIANNNADTSWSIDGGSAQATDAQVAAASYVTFSGVSTGGDGTLVLTGLPDGTDGIAPEMAFVSALQVTAIPEPATIGMVAAFGGAILFIRRRMAM